MLHRLRLVVWPLLALLLSAAATAAQPGSVPSVVVRVVDGDTIHVRVDGRLERVRYIGINTPELHHPARGAEPGGQEAREVNRELVDGQPARLELDAQRRDRHGRLLAYVWVRGVMVNAELVRRGYAQVMTVPPNVRYQELFLTLQREARQSGRGLWGGAS
ncbi:MAG TPA: thermonuclease family protein [Methylomirabilota bacterium]|nr:thermonuclease family protein [Methylomirabilota bacterium]